MNDATRYFAVDGRENWRGVAQLDRYCRQWEDNAEAVCSIDVEAYESYSYHPRPLSDLDAFFPKRRIKAAILDLPSGPAPESPQVGAETTTFNPLSVEEYARIWGLVPLGVNLYRGEDKYIEVTAYELRKRARAGEFGEYIIYRNNRYLVHPAAVAQDIERIKARQKAEDEAWARRERVIETATPFRITYTQTTTAELSIKMQCRNPECLARWVTAGAMTEFCPKCYLNNVNEYRDAPICITCYEDNERFPRPYPWLPKAQPDGYCGSHKRAAELRALMNKGMTYLEAVARLRAQRSAQ